MMVAKYVFFSFVNAVRSWATTPSRRGLTVTASYRLLAASYHQPEVTKEMWERAKDLDGQRKARLG